MNVPQTQNSLFRQMDAAAIVANVQQASEQAQRQAALSEQREAAHRQGSVAESESSKQSAGIGGQPGQDADGQPGGGKRFRAPVQEEERPLKDAIHPGPLGRHLDVTA
jgi:hypothetical protein